jgi:outer membrane lipoprotein-sorting protein
MTSGHDELLRRRRALRLITLTLVGATVAAHGRERAFDLPSLMAELAKNGPGTVRFTEIKSLAYLKQPIEQSGTLTYTAPARLERHTLAPREERFVIDADALVIERPAKGERLKVRLADYPAVRAFAESIRGTLAGDLAALKRFYRVELDGAWSDWRLILLPSDPQMAELVQRVRIGGTDGRVKRIEILETSGDRSVMTITGAKASS